LVSCTGMTLPGAILGTAAVLVGVEVVAAGADCVGGGA
jgi:hypothetical protein